MSDPSAHNFSGSNSPAQKQFSPTRFDALATLALKASTGQVVQAICDAFVHVISFTVTGLISGGVFVRLGNGVEQTVDQNGDYAFAFNDAAQSDFTIGGNDFTGTISNIGCRKMT